MQRLQAYEFQIEPNGEQLRDLRRFAGSCRFVFNKALAMQKTRYEQGEKKLGYAGLCQLVTGWRNGSETPWLKDAPTHPLQQTLKDSERAYRNFFEKRAGFPRFKKKGQGGSFRYPDPKQIKLDQPNSRIFLPNLGWLRYRNSRDVPGEVRNATVSRSGGKWFVSIRDMSKSATGSGDSPGRNVKAKSGLNKSMLDQGWFEFRRQLEYWSGGMLVAENRRTQARPACVGCGFEENADVVGAINVLARGHRVAACGEPAQQGRPTKQEPTEATGREATHA